MMECTENIFQNDLLFAVMIYEAIKSIGDKNNNMMNKLNI
jgi:hypothetical protein